MDSASGAGAGYDSVALLPIDITYSKLADWLADRRRIPADWRKKVASLRARIAAAFSTLPLSLDPWLQTLTVENTGYLEARRIRNILAESNPDSRNFFGRLSGIAGEWDGIVRAYEKELLQLGEAAQIMVHYTDYEIPSHKREIAKLQHQLTDMEKKESEYKRNAAAAAARYQQSCEELGIKGNDVKAELKMLGKSLPTVFMEVVQAVSNDVVGESIEMYQAMISYAHPGSQGEQQFVLPTLQDLRDHPPSFAESEVGSHEQKTDTVVIEGISKEDHNQPDDRGGTEGANDSIDWGVDSVERAPSCQDVADQIDWGIGADNVDQVVESSDGIDWGIGTLSDDHTSADASQNIIWDFESDSGFDLQQNSGLEEGTEAGAGINWDIDLDESGVGGADHFDTQLQEVSSYGQQTGVGRFLETEYRNMLLNDLFELKAFVKQRVEELERQETAALQNQVQAMAPAACFKHGSDALRDMALHIVAAIDLLTAQKTRDLCLLVTSSRFLDRLHLSLVSKKESETKLLASLRDLSQKRTELRNSLTLLWSKQDFAMKRTREVKEHVEKSLSALYEGRPVHIIGTINTILGVA